MPCVRKRVAFAVAQALGRRQRLVSLERLQRQAARPRGRRRSQPPAETRAAVRDLTARVTIARTARPRRSRSAISCRQVTRIVWNPAAAARWSRRRSLSNARRVPWCLWPSVSTITRCHRHRKSGLIGCSPSPRSSHGWISGSGSPTLRLSARNRSSNSFQVAVDPTRCSLSARRRAPAARLRPSFRFNWSMRWSRSMSSFGLGRVEDSLEATPRQHASQVEDRSRRCRARDSVDRRRRRLVSASTSDGSGFRRAGDRLGWERSRRSGPVRLEQIQQRSGRADATGRRRGHRRATAAIRRPEGWSSSSGTSA